MFSGLRLVGGTSLSLQIGHRKSIDLDLFGAIDEDSLTITKALSEIGKTTILKTSKNIQIFLIDGVKTEIVNYHYPWLEGENEFEKIRYAGTKDIAAMKMAAITGRGAKKDFFDLYYLLQIYSLKEILTFYEEKYSDGSVMMVLKSLNYFDDADLDSEPLSLHSLSWNQVKLTIRKIYNNYINTL